MEVGRRIQTLKQLFNIKQGIDPLSLKVSPRVVGEPPLTEGPNRGRSFDLEKMMKDYWQEIGWERETGKPTAETIEELGLKAVVEGKEEEFPVLVDKESLAPVKRKKPAKGEKPSIDIKTCVYCGACVQECPVSCLALKPGDGSNPHYHPYPVLAEPEKCISCGFCEECCPVEAITMKINN
jgi:ferredoxin